MENVQENVDVKIEVTLELIKNIRNVIEVSNQRISWKTEELLPVGFLIKQIDDIIKENEKKD